MSHEVLRNAALDSLRSLSLEALPSLPVGALQEFEDFLHYPAVEQLPIGDWL